MRPFNDIIVGENQLTTNKNITYVITSCILSFSINKGRQYDKMVLHNAPNVNFNVNTNLS